MATLREILGRFMDASLTLNLAKCEFGKAVVTYLYAILDFHEPNTRQQLRRFLGMCGYYRGFCRNFASVVSPLSSLLSPSVQFVWTPVCQEAFQSPKALLCSAPVLIAPDFEHPFKMEVDASATGVAAVLLQEDDHSIDHPLCYFSKKFNRHQVIYSIVEKESCLTMGLATLRGLCWFRWCFFHTCATTISALCAGPFLISRSVTLKG